MILSDEALYVQLGYLVAEAPNLQATRTSPDVLKWLGRADALVCAVGDLHVLSQLRSAAQLYLTGRGAGSSILAAVYQGLAHAELNAPASVQGSFIPAGNVFDAMAAVGKVLQTAKQDVLIVDPYMDEKTLTDFAVLSPEGVTTRLLADLQLHKTSLTPAALRWASQYGNARPLETRLTPARSLHDRLIAVDSDGVWTVTQSFNRLASRSPAAIVRVDPETAGLKLDAYEAMWKAAVPF